MTDTRTPLARSLAGYADRCSGCGYHVETQGCECNGTLKFSAPERAKAEGIARATNAADPDDRARIDAAIRQVAARGGEFSANDVRPLLGDLTGPLVGARFNALAKAGEIEHVGFVKSSKGSTNAHRILTWRAA